jgi:hypothetical protein
VVASLIVGQGDVAEPTQGGKQSGWVPPQRVFRCHEVGDVERTQTEYWASREYGSARRLRGNVALVSIRVGGSAARWTPSLVGDALIAGELSRKFYVEQARAAGLDDLEVHFRPHGLESATFMVPSIATDPHRVMTGETASALRAAIEESIRGALAHTLDQLTDEYRAKGYDEVAYLIELPILSPPRSQAFRAFAQRDAPRAAEVAFVMEAESDLGRHAMIFAHEGLHLFGADDLYRITPRDPLDVGDIMGDACEHVIPANVGDTTAWAIGWRDDVPTRKYAIRQ